MLNDPINLIDPDGKNALALCRLGGQVGFSFGGPAGAVVGVTIVGVGIVGNSLYNTYAKGQKGKENLKISPEQKEKLEAELSQPNLRPRDVRKIKKKYKADEKDRGDRGKGKDIK